MENKKSILLFPGAFQFVKNYGDYDGIDIWLRTNREEKIPNADFIVAHSAGAVFVVLSGAISKAKKIILINPPIKKRNNINIFFRWIKFLVLEGMKMGKVVPITNWIYGLKKVLSLLKVNMLEIIQKIPKEKIVIIRGRKDNFFCDKESVEIIKNNSFNVIEADAGHDWNQNIAEVVANLISN